MTTGGGTLEDYIQQLVNTAVAAAIADVHSISVHFDAPLTVRVFNYPATSIKAVLELKGSDMPGTISVDYTSETATVSFVDDHGDAVDAPAGAVATFSSDNEAVATVAADATNPLQGDITPVAEGSCNVSVSFNGTALEADGVTAIPDPAAVA